MPDRTAPWPRRPRQGAVAHVTPHRTPSGKVRWLTTLTPGPEAAYAASVAAVVPTVERCLGPSTIADRARPGTDGIVRLAPWEPHDAVRSGAPTEAVERVVACLRAFADDGVRGLPVGPAASAVLGNVVLTGLDGAFERRGIPHLRWVDDLLGFAPSRREARLTLDGIRLAAIRTGLELHEGKTRIVEDPVEARALVGGPNSPGAGAGVP